VPPPFPKERSMSPRKILPLDVLGTLFQAKPIRPKTARRDPPSRLTLDRAPDREREDGLRAEKQALVLEALRI
jgi:hypothetical protein